MQFLTRRSSPVFASVLVLAAGWAHAQTLDDATRSEPARQFHYSDFRRDDAAAQLATHPALEAPSSPGDPDLGQQVILKKPEKAQPFSAYATFSGYYTSNAALTDRDTTDDFFGVGEIGVSYLPRISKDLTAEVTVRQADFRYADLDELDFESLNAGAGLTYIARPLWDLAFSLRYNYNRLTDGNDHREFFKNQTLSLSVLKTFSFSKAHYGYVGYSSVFGWSDPVAPQRDEHGVFLGYRANLTRALSADLYYRVAYFDYVNARHDWNQTLVAMLKLDVTRWLSVSVSTSGGWNNSNRNVFDYAAFNAGFSLGAAVTF